MTSSSKSIIYREDYKALPYVIDKVALQFELDEQHTIVTNTMQMRALDKREPLKLNGEALELLEVAIDGTTLTNKQYKLSDNQLILSKLNETFELRIKTKIYPHKNTELSGLYSSNSLYCTQCEAEGFRRITYYLDRPDIMASFTTKIIANKKRYPVLLSNGNLIETGEIKDNHYVIWQDPYKKPSYLFALVAGDLVSVDDSFTTKSGKDVILKLFVEPGNEAKCQHALASLKKAMAWDEKVYGREYDLDIYMIVAVSDFNMGAMENKGLNIFNDKYILASPKTATDMDHAAIEGVVAHEYFHNWTGNRITCRDWFQLSLKEGLTVFRDQEFSRDMHSRDVNRIKDVNVLRTHQFPEDNSPMAHPVRPESYMEINNFYTATVYNKGAEVIRMQSILLGAKGFQKGMQLYFERHDGMAVTIDDFVASMEHANHVDLSQFKRWYSQAGTPEVRVKTDYKEGTLSLHLNQHCAKTPGQEEKLPFHIPISIALFNEKGEKIETGIDLIELKEEKQTIEFNNLDKKPVVSLLRGFSAPVRLHIDYSESELLLLARYETDGFSRYEAVKRFVKKQIQQLMVNKEADISLNCQALYEAILNDDKTDNALKAELLKPIGFEEIASDVKKIDVDNIINSIDKWENTLALLLNDAFKQSYDALHLQNSGEMNAKAYADRALKHVCLYYLCRNDKGLKTAYQQFNQALTMTDELSAFKCLVERDSPYFDKAKEAFYQRWDQDSLVLDKWFSAIALSRRTDTLALIQALEKHPKFNAKNPNKVRALVASFASGNHRLFHRPDGKAYQWLKDWILYLDSLNPQVASRLVVPLIRWHRYEEKWGNPMKQCLEELLTHKLSPDVFEMVSKSVG